MLTRRPALAGALALLLLPLVPARAGAQEATPPPPGASESTSPPAAPPLPPLAPANADALARAQAVAEVRRATIALKTAVVAERKAQRAIPATQTAVAAAEAVYEAASAKNREASDRLADARRRLREMAVGSYVTSGDVSSINLILSSKDANELHRRRIAVSGATEARKDVVVAHEQSLAAVSSETIAALEARDRAVDHRDRTVQAAADATALIALRKTELADRTALVDLVTAGQVMAPSDLPRLILEAYQRGAERVKLEHPTCGISWPLIAAIGKVESNHGRYGGSSFTIAGEVLPQILGIPLDGTRSALITDTDGGQMDGDVVYDRAVGPMQFIPSTWAWAKRDGNGDGFMNPHNIFDAANATGSYLCRAAAPAGGVITPQGLHDGIFSYNHSEEYVALVTMWKATYEAWAPALPGLPPPPPPAPPAQPNRRRR